MIRPEPSIADNPDVLSVVRDHLSKHRECQEWDGDDLAQALRLPEMKVQYALEALRDDEGELLT